MVLISIVCSSIDVVGAIGIKCVPIHTSLSCRGAALCTLSSHVLHNNADAGAQSMHLIRAF